MIEKEPLWIPVKLPCEAKPHTIDPETGIWPMSEWGSACYRGFVSDARFSSTSQVIPRTNRDVSRKWRQLDNARHR